LSIGELASMYPSAPGVRTYLKSALGDRASLLLVYLYLISVVLIAGLESYIFSQVWHAVFPSAATLPTIATLLGAVAAVNLAGMELPRSLQVVATIAAVAFILVSGALGLWSAPFSLAGGVAPITPHLMQSLAAAAGMSVFLYMGFEWVTPLGLRPASYQWKVPVAMAISVAVLAITYEMFALGMASQLSREAISTTSVPQVSYLEALYGPTGVYLALALALAATLSTFNAGIMGGARLIYILSREGRLPAWCAWMSARTGAPVGAVILLGSLALLSAIAVMVWDAVLLVAVIGAAIICILYSSFLLSVLLLRRSRPTAARPYRTPVWVPLQWFGVIGLPLLGLQTLMSEPSLGTRPIYGGAIAIAVAAALTWTYGSAPRATTRDGSPSSATGGAM